MGGSKKTKHHPRKFPGAKSPAPHNFKFRCEEAAERQAAYSALSVVERIALLDRKLGQGVGAKKQRTKLELQQAQKNLQKSLRIPEEFIGHDVSKVKAKERREEQQRVRPGHQSKQ